MSGDLVVKSQGGKPIYNDVSYENEQPSVTPDVVPVLNSLIDVTLSSLAPLCGRINRMREEAGLSFVH